jgi:hypothetical protein
MWNWLYKPQKAYSWRFAIVVIVKAAILFLVINIVFAGLNLAPDLGRLSLYNVVWPGRLRLPYGDNPDQSYNLSLNNLNAMFASHSIAGTPKAPDEFRVIVIGDSSTWGVLLKPEETLAGYLNAAGYITAHGKQVKVYNLGYPIKSLAKDMLILSYAMRYQPDLILWPLTLESFAKAQQLNPLLVRENPAPMRGLVALWHITSINRDDPAFDDPTFLDRTLVGQRRQLADILRLQLYGAMWKNTGIDQVYPRFFVPRRENFDRDTTWQTLNKDSLTEDDLSFDVLKAGLGIAGAVPVLLINEPIFVSSGVNSDLRYNAFYPRWAYDSYRTLLSTMASDNAWNYVDAWDSIAADQFTDSAVHLTPAGSRQFADQIGTIMMKLIDGANANLS